MSVAQTGHTFADELKSLGIVIPPDTTAITILAESVDSNVNMLFEHVVLNSVYVRKTKAERLKDKNGKDITPTDFFNAIKVAAQLPQDTIGFDIRAEVNKIVEINIKAALPQGALSGLKEILT